MIFIINNLKYDTNQMELISEKIIFKRNTKYSFLKFKAKEDNEYGKLFRSKNGRYLLTNKSLTQGIAITEDTAKLFLLKQDLCKYLEVFGSDLEDA